MGVAMVVSDGVWVHGEFVSVKQMRTIQKVKFLSGRRLKERRPSNSLTSMHVFARGEQMKESMR